MFSVILLCLKDGLNLRLPLPACQGVPGGVPGDVPGIPSRLLWKSLWRSRLSRKSIGWLLMLKKIIGWFLFIFWIWTKHCGSELFGIRSTCFCSPKVCDFLTLFVGCRRTSAGLENKWFRDVWGTICETYYTHKIPWNCMWPFDWNKFRVHLAWEECLQ